jgi:hypothetical protein
MSIMKNKTPDRRINNVQNISISDKKAINYKIKQTQQVTVPSSEENKLCVGIESCKAFSSLPFSLNKTFP